MPEDDDPVHIRIDGAMATLLAQLGPDRYDPCMVTNRKGKNILFTKANKAIYGTLKAALLFWEKLSGTLKEWGYVANPYDSCTMNKMIDGKQCTILWHVDDRKISHVNPNVVTSILNQLDGEFGGVSPLTVTRGAVHEYFRMTINYSQKGKVKFSMFDYLEDIVANFPDDLKMNRNTATSAADHLFTVSESAVKLIRKQAVIFHQYVAKPLFAVKRARPDIRTANAFLCTRVQHPDVDDWKKLAQVLGYIKDTIFIPQTIGGDGTGSIYWYVDASFAVHHNMKSHTGGMMTFGVGAAISMLTKQKLNTKSSTKAELVGVDDIKLLARPSSARPSKASPRAPAPPTVNSNASVARANSTVTPSNTTTVATSITYLTRIASATSRLLATTRRIQNTHTATVMPYIYP